MLHTIVYTSPTRFTHCILFSVCQLTIYAWFQNDFIECSRNRGLAFALFWFWKNANSNMFTSDFNDRMVERGWIFFLYRKFLWGSPLVAFILCLLPPQTWQLNWTFIDELLKPVGFDFRFCASFIKLIRSFEPSNIYRLAENKYMHL